MIANVKTVDGSVIVNFGSEFTIEVADEKGERAEALRKRLVKDFSEVAAVTVTFIV